MRKELQVEDGSEKMGFGRLGKTQDSWLDPSLSLANFFQDINEGKQEEGERPD